MLSERNEKVLIEIELNKDKTVEYKKELEMFDCYVPVPELGSLKLTYKFSVDYFDDCVNKMQALAKIIRDRSIVSKVNLTELIHNKCIIYELLGAIKQIESRY